MALATAGALSARPSRVVLTGRPLSGSIALAAGLILAAAVIGTRAR